MEYLLLFERLQVWEPDGTARGRARSNVYIPPFEIQLLGGALFPRQSDEANDAARIGKANVVDDAIRARRFGVATRLEDEAEPVPVSGARDESDEQALRFELGDGKARENAVLRSSER